MMESTIHAFEHKRFGRLDLPEEALIHCDGLPGFPEARRLALLDHDRPSWFAWLVCLELPEHAFAVTDPLRFYPDYAPKAHHNDLRALSATPEDEIDVLVIANVTPKGTFLNLAAPLLVNPKQRRAIQAILTDETWPLWAPLHAKEGVREQAQMESNPHR